MSDEKIAEIKIRCLEFGALGSGCTDVQLAAAKKLFEWIMTKPS